MKPWLKHAIVVAGVIAVITAGLFVREAVFRSSNDAQLWFFNVGQGDSEFIRAPGKTMLIDGGPDDAVLEGLSKALPWWDKKIDVVMLTHPHADHFTGLIGVLKRYQVGEVWWNGVAVSSGAARAFMQTVEESGVPIHVAKAGDRIDFGGDRVFEVLYPFESLAGQPVRETTLSKSGGLNDTSIVGRLSCGSEHAYYSGDSGFPTEELLLKKGIPLEAELLKIGHHGSAYASSEAFLDAVKPKDAVISDGAGNRYGHPAPRVLAALLRRGIAIHRTDRDGTVRFVCHDGHLRQAYVLPF